MTRRNCESTSQATKFSRTLATGSASKRWSCAAVGWATSIAAVTAMDDRKFMESASLWIWSERDAGILGEPQGLVEMRVIKYDPKPTNDLTIGPRSIRKHALHRSQCECGKRVAAALQRRLYGGRTHEIAESHNRRGIRQVVGGRYPKAQIGQGRELHKRPVPWVKPWRTCTSGWGFKRPPAVGAKTAGAARSLDPPELRGRANQDRQSP
jgi:hypothetical protein